VRRHLGAVLFELAREHGREVAGEDLRFGIHDLLGRVARGERQRRAVCASSEWAVWEKSTRWTHLTRADGTLPFDFAGCSNRGGDRDSRRRRRVDSKVCWEYAGSMPERCVLGKTRVFWRAVGHGGRRGRKAPQSSPNASNSPAPVACARTANPRESKHAVGGVIGLTPQRSPSASHLSGWLHYHTRGQSVCPVERS
jgi:hypothetical protein